MTGLLQIYLSVVKKAAFKMPADGTLVRQGPGAASS